MTFAVKRDMHVLDGHYQYTDKYMVWGSYKEDDDPAPRECCIDTRDEAEEIAREYED